MEALQRVAILERAYRAVIAAADHFHAVRQVNVPQLVAVAERALPDLLQARVENHILQVGAISERAVSDADQAGRQVQLFQRAVIAESVIPDRRDPVRLISHFRYNNSFAFAHPSGNGRFTVVGEGKRKLLGRRGNRFVGNAFFTAVFLAISIRITPGDKIPTAQKSIISNAI